MRYITIMALMGCLSLCLLVTGCGGGGGGDPQVSGIANINYQSTKPMVGIIYANPNGSSFLTATSASMPTVSNGGGMSGGLSTFLRVAALPQTTSSVSSMT